MCFAQSTANRVKSHKTVQAAITGVKKLHQMMGAPTKIFDDYLFNLSLKGMARKCTFVAQQARLMTPELLEKIHHKLDFSNIKDAVFWLTCILGFFLLFRKSNLLPRTKTFDPSKQLTWGDIEITPFNLVVSIRWSKTDQFGRELKRYPLPIIPGSKLCPKAAILTVLKLMPDSTMTSHVGQLPDGSSFTYSQFQARLRGVLAEVLGEEGDPEGFSSHSFRRGGATFAYLCGVPAESHKTSGKLEIGLLLKILAYSVTGSHCGVRAH